MTTFQRLVTLYWCLLPLELVFTWLDVTRQRAVRGAWQRVVAARRQLRVVPGVAVQYVVAFAVVLALVARLRRLDEAQQLVAVACSALLLLQAWQDVRRIADAWHDSEYGGWWRRLRQRVAEALRRAQPTPVAAPA